MIMKKRLPLVPLVLLMLALGGCATSPPYGNFVNPPVAVDQEPLAGEAARQLAALWPPARTRFALQHPTPDAFGAALVGELRTAGFAVLELGPEKASAAASEQISVESAQGLEPSPAALPLRYVLDHDADTGLYRLTLWVGTQSLTRPYRAQDRTLIAAGYWVRKQ